MFRYNYQSIDDSLLLESINQNSLISPQQQRVLNRSWLYHEKEIEEKQLKFLKL